MTKGRPASWLAERARLERLAGRLAGRIERCYFSFVTEYHKVRRNFCQVLVPAGISICGTSILRQPAVRRRHRV